MTASAVTLACNICHANSGNSLVCDSCRPRLTDYQKHKLTVAWHKIIVEGDNFQCSYCGRSFEAESGQLCGDHIHPKSSHPHLRYDITNGRATCTDCHNQRHSGHLSPHKTMAQNRKDQAEKKSKYKKPPVCKNYGCPIFVFDRHPSGECHKCRGK